MVQRLPYLDNLRAIATLLLLPYHAGRIFDWPHYYLKGDRTDGFEIFCRFMDVWYMPLFFVIAGAAASFSLRHRTSIEFLSERLRRLMIPFFLVGLFLMPINGYLAYQFQNNISISFWTYLPQFLKLDPKDLAGFKGGFAFGHLWFLLYLTIFSAFLIILIHSLQFALSESSCSRFLHQYKRLSQHRLDQRAIAGLMTVTPLTLCIARGFGWDYPSLIYFLPFYLWGFSLFCSGLQTKILNHFGPWLLGLGLATMAAFISIRLGQTNISREFGYETLQAINAFCWAIGLLYLGTVFLDQEKPWLRWVNCYGLAIYVIHIPAITIVGFFILRLVDNIILAWGLITSLSMLITLGCSISISRIWSLITVQSNISRS